MFKLAFQLGLLIFFINFPGGLLAGEVYRINTHVFIHQGYQNTHPKIQEQILDIITEVNVKFKEQKIPAVLELKDIEVFDLELSTSNFAVIPSIIPVVMRNQEMDLYDYLHDIYFVLKKVFPPKDIILVFVKRVPANTHWGMAVLPNYFPHVAVLFPPENEWCLNKNCFPYLVHLFAHEVCHFFNAENLKSEKYRKYLMSNAVPWKLQEPAYFKMDKENRKRILKGLREYYK